MPADRRAAAPRDAAGLNLLMKFGHGKLIVNTGTFNDEPAVFIAGATSPGVVGGSVFVSEVDRHTLQPGELVMTFPTAGQVQAVADALVGSRIAPPAAPPQGEGVPTLETNIGWFIGRARKDGFHVQADWLESQIAALRPASAEGE